jgi:beta-lactam-binding protein with PASTA domain
VKKPARIVTTLIVATLALAAGTVSGCTEGATGTGSGSATGKGAKPVPKVTGMHLEKAEGILSAAGFTDVRPQDATSQHRVVVNPANWLVRSQAPVAGTQAATSATITLKVGKPGDDVAAPAVTAGVVPKVVCLDLQKAQDALQKAGFSNLASHDGLGKGRAQLLDRNWLVTAQSAKAGSRPATGTRITLTTVKYGEPAGSSGCES